MLRHGDQRWKIDYIVLGSAADGGPSQKLCSPRYALQSRGAQHTDSGADGGVLLLSEPDETLIGFWEGSLRWKSCITTTNHRSHQSTCETQLWSNKNFLRSSSCQTGSLSDRILVKIGSAEISPKQKPTGEIAMGSSRLFGSVMPSCPCPF